MGALDVNKIIIAILSGDNTITSELKQEQNTGRHAQSRPAPSTFQVPCSLTAHGFAVV
jgi:hypothetical protein